MPIYDELQSLENFIDSGIPIFGFLRIFEYKILIEKIKGIENTLPQEILQNRIKLIKNGQGEVFKHIENMLQIVEKSFRLFGTFAVIDTNKILNLVDRIYAEVPTAVQCARGNFVPNEEQNTIYKDIEIPDFLKRTPNQ